MERSPRICILGMGYIGLPTALLFAKNFDVVGVDINKSVIETLNNHKLPFDETKISKIFSEVENNITFSDEIQDADVFIIAVPTPLNKSIMVSDLTYVKSAATMVKSKLKENNLVILESTVPPGASDKIILPILQENLGMKKIFYAHCPERAIPGSTINEMINNDRIIGGINPESSEYARKIYSTFVRGNTYLTNTKTAEFVKLIENTYRDVNIALANELAKIADESRINYWEAKDLANKHPRVNLHNPGPGVGGHCIAIDPWFLTENSTKTGIIQYAREINDLMPNYVIHLLRNILEDVQKPNIALFGVAYKGNIGDVRETPALKFIQLAENEGFELRCYDPYVKSFDYPLYDMEESLLNCDCIVIFSDHEQFKSIDPRELNVRNKRIIDCRNIIDKTIWNSAGFTTKILGDGQ